jgi:hypothetical protein
VASRRNERRDRRDAIKVEKDLVEHIRLHEQESTGPEEAARTHQMKDFGAIGAAMLVAASSVAAASVLQHAPIRAARSASIWAGCGLGVGGYRHLSS